MAGITATAVTPIQPDYIGNRTCERYTLTNGSPTALTGTGAGSATGGTVSLAGALGGTLPTDYSGQITVINGTTSVAAGTIVVMTFANTMSGTVHPVISPANATAAALGGATIPIIVGGTAGFNLLLGAGATLTTLGTYVWNYVVPDANTNLVINTLWLRKPDQAVCSQEINTTSFGVATCTLGITPGFTSGTLELRGLV